MTPLAPTVTKYFRVFLPKDRGFSHHTCETYSHALRLFLIFAATKLKVKPSDLFIEQLDAKLVLDFLNSIEETRKNSSSTRNSRLAAIKSFMRFLEFKKPSMMEQVRQIQLITSKRHDVPLIKHLTLDEVQSILNAPDITTRLGIRDRAMMHVCFAGALRVSELVELPIKNVSLQKIVSIKVIGKGRRERCLPLWKETAKDLRSWLAVRGAVDTEALFVNADGSPMSRSGFSYILNKYVRIASKKIPSLVARKISPHQLRHSCALIMLQATKDIRKVSLWLGHADISTTEIYLRTDPNEKLEAVESVVPPSLRRGRFKAPDDLIASLFC